jgi:hypothetical protein
MQQLAELQAREPAFLQIGEADPNGEVRSSAVAAKAPVNLQDRAWFQQSLRTRDLVVGDVIVSRIVGKPTITLSRPNGGTAASPAESSISVSAWSGWRIGVKARD